MHLMMSGNMSAIVSIESVFHALFVQAIIMEWSCFFPLCRQHGQMAMTSKPRAILLYFPLELRLSSSCIFLNVSSSLEMTHYFV